MLIQFDLLSSGSLSSAYSGVYLIDLETNQTLYENNAKQLFIPASLTKLFTAAAASQVLPNDLRFRTSVKLHGVMNKDVAYGSLILCGGGDPTLTSAGLLELAKALYRNGLRKIEGAVSANDDFLEGTHVPPHQECSDLTWDYAPEISALSVDNNSLNLIIESPTQIDQPAIVILEQVVPYGTVINRLKTVECTYAPGLFQKTDCPFPLNIRRGLNNNIFDISGEIHDREDKVSEKVAIHNPSEYARLIFLSYLKQVGIEVIETHNKPNNNATMHELAFIESEPLPKILQKMNKESDNLAAELMLLTIGQKHSSCTKSYVESALNVIEQMLESCSDSRLDYILYDGAGSSKHNLVSPFLVVSLLKSLYQSDQWEMFFNSLPIAGVDGTLKDRYKGTKGENIIYAKTGTHSDVSNLAGYIFTPSGKKMAFCICVNNHRLSSKACRQQIDDFLLTLIDPLL